MISIFLGLSVLEQKNSLYYFKAPKTRTMSAESCKVLVYGGTPSGSAAALQSARMGKKTTLVGCDRFVGGMTSAGLTATDIGDPKSIGGIAHEFYQRIVAIKDFSPSATETLFRTMLGEAGVNALLNQPLDRVAIIDGRILTIGAKP